MGNNFAIQPYKWNFGSIADISSAGGRSHETFDEYQKRIEKERAENAKKRKEIDEQISIIKTQRAELVNDSLINKAKKGEVQEDNTIKIKETMTDYKKLPWWKKTLRAGSNMLTGVWKLATGFFGYETDKKTGEQKWKPLNLLKNTAIAGACIGLCFIPYVGPLISTALIATGVATGAWQAGKGIYKVCKAKTPKQIDEAFQDIGSGVAVGAASCVGLKGLGKGLQASSSSAAVSSGATGLTRAVGRNAVSQFAKDCTINAGRATVHGMRASRAALKNNINSMSGWKSKWGIRHILGFGKSYTQNVKSAIPKFGKTKFENEKNMVNQTIDEQLAQIEARQNSIQQEILTNPKNAAALDSEFALLNREQAYLTAQKAQINSAVTRKNYKLLSKRSEAHKEAKYLSEAVKKLKKDGFVDLQMPNGNSYRLSLDSNGKNLQALKNLAKSANEAAKKAEELAKLRASSMRLMSLKKGAKTEVEDYTGKVRSFRLARLYDTTPKVTWKTPFSVGLKAMALPFKPWSYVENSAASTGYKIEQAFFAPHYEDEIIGELSSMFGEKIWGDKILMAELPAYNENGEMLKNTAGNIIKEKSVVTKDVLSQLEAAQKNYDEAISALETQKNNLKNIA